MGFLDLFKKEKSGKTDGSLQSVELQTEPGIVYQPVDGEVISLEDIGDEIFSAGILGKGCGLKPAGECVYAPIDGTISFVADTGHAIGITGMDNLELLIHIGLDTVEMKGDGFGAKVKAGDNVKAGQPLMSFSKKKIADAGYPDTIAVLVANTMDYKDVVLLRIGAGKKGEKMLRIEA